MGQNRRQSDEHDEVTFEEQSELARPGFLGEFYAFLRYRKKWWLSPVIVVLLLVAVVIVLSSTAAAPLLYTLF